MTDSSYKLIIRELDLNFDPALLSQEARVGGPNAGAFVTRNEIGATRALGSVTPTIVGANTLYADAYAQQEKKEDQIEGVAQRREDQLDVAAQKKEHLQDAAEDKKEQLEDAAEEKRSTTAPVFRPYKTTP